MDTCEDQLTIRLEDQSLTDRGIAGELLNRLRKRSRGMVTGKLVGQSADFDFLVLPTLDNKIQLVLRIGRAALQPYTPKSERV